VTSRDDPSPPRHADTYLESGGLRWGRGRFGSINATWPFARLRATPQRIQIRVVFPLLWRNFILVREDVVAVRPQNGIFSTGVRFEHRNSTCPECLLFWTFRRARLLAALADLGYATGTEAT
jgi:hypothetical protein